MKQVDCIQASVFDSPCNYDMIVGRDFLQRAGIKLDFEHGSIEWLGQKVAMKATVDGLQPMR
eukprot:11404322-Ditylum_brightwellii.AAC.1